VLRVTADWLPPLRYQKKHRCCSKKLFKIPRQNNLVARGGIRPPHADRYFARYSATALSSRVSAARCARLVPACRGPPWVLGVARAFTKRRLGRSRYIFDIDNAFTRQDRHARRNPTSFRAILVARRSSFALSRAARTSAERVRKRQVRIEGRGIPAVLRHADDRR
jgi:hypothetical protein